MTTSRFDMIGRTLRSTLSTPERLLLIALIQRIRTSGRQERQTWAKIDQLADDVGMERRNVRRTLDKLEGSGQIQRWRQPNSYLYRIPPVWDEVAVSDDGARIR